MNMIKMMEMKRMITVCLMSALVTMATYAQTPLKKVYDETINPFEQIDQALDFVMSRRVSKLKMLRLIGKYKNGTYPEAKAFRKLLTVRRGKKMKIECAKPAVVNIDGECLTATEVTFEVIPQALRLIVNEKL